MSTIPSYPVPAGPLDGSELLAGWKDGGQKAITIDLIAQRAGDAGVREEVVQGVLAGTRTLYLDHAPSATDGESGQLARFGSLEYGPKTGAGWGTPRSLIGAQGADTAGIESHLVGAAGIALPAGAKFVSTGGYSASGDGGRAGYGLALSGGSDALTITDTANGGRTFEMTSEAGSWKAESYGAHRSASAATNVASLNKLIRHAKWMTQNGRGNQKVRLAGGQYQIAASILDVDHSSGSYAFHGTAYEAPARGYATLGMTRLMATTALANLPMLVIQSSRHSSFKNIGFTGVTGATFPTPLQLLGARYGGTPWMNPNGVRTNLSSPHCGAGIDVLNSDYASGSDQYVGVGAPYQSSPGFSRGLVFDECEFDACYVGIFNLGNQQNDHIVVRRCRGTSLRALYGAGNSQARDFTLEKPYPTGCDTIVDVLSFGSGIGCNFNVTEGLSEYVRYQVMFSSGYGSPVIDKHYAEQTYSYGFDGGGIAPLIHINTTTKFFSGINQGYPSPDVNGHLPGGLRVTGGYHGKYYNDPEPICLFLGGGEAVFRDALLDCMPIANDMTRLFFDKVKFRYVGSRHPVGGIIRDALVTVGSVTYEQPAVIGAEVWDTSGGDFRYTMRSNFDTYDIETVTMTVDPMTGTGTFTTAKPNDYFGRDTFYTGFRQYVVINSTWHGEDPLSFANGKLAADYAGLGAMLVHSKVGSTITLKGVPWTIANSAGGTVTLTLGTRRWQTIRARCIGQLAAGSSTITGVSTNTYKAGDPIRANLNGSITALDQGTRVQTVTGTAPNMTITLTKPVPAGVNGVAELMDAQVTLSYARSNGQFPSGPAVRGDRVDYDQVSNPAALTGWACTQSGIAGGVQSPIWTIRKDAA